MIEARPAIEGDNYQGLSPEEIGSLTPKEIYSLIRVKLEVLYPTGRINREMSGRKQCMLINDLGLLEEGMPMQMIVADPPPSKEEIRMALEMEKARRLAEEIKYLSGLERPKGKRPNHRHPI